MVKVMLAALASALMTLHAAQAGSWDAVATLAPGTKLEVIAAERGRPRGKGRFVNATSTALVLQNGHGESTWHLAEIKAVKIAAPSRRSRNGLLGVAIGAGAGLAAGAAVCPYCANEGHSGFYLPGLLIGAGVGAIAFLPLPYQTIYKAPRK